jgi:hypothetical protein
MGGILIKIKSITKKYLCLVHLERHYSNYLIDSGNILFIIFYLLKGEAI